MTFRDLRFKLGMTFMAVLPPRSILTRPTLAWYPK